MVLQRYELLILTVPEITNDEATDLEKTIEKKLQEHKATLVLYDRWGKFLLAYPIKRNEYGVYFLARFDAPENKKQTIITELKELFDLKYNLLVMRSVTSHIANDAPLSYKRPQSLEETPKDVDRFLKDNKMAGIAPRRAGDFEDSFTHRTEREEV